MGALIVHRIPYQGNFALKLSSEVISPAELSTNQARRIGSRSVEDGARCVRLEPSPLSAPGNGVAGQARMDRPDHRNARFLRDRAEPVNWRLQAASS